ncbi:nuclear transport factor 2 family protein [Cupriavidus sp. TMH.W2]|uniref:nuclear transport factor 2 family protein n=1 Tax=Cupriavidus sp. TMH.W2 TaxID=3434465 RepID=UPI003D78995E
MNLEILLAVREIQAAHSRYARALDERNWGQLDTIFAPDVQADYGGGGLTVRPRGTHQFSSPRQHRLRPPGLVRSGYASPGPRP